MNRALTVLAVLLALVFTGAVQAAPLGLVQAPPDITVGFLMGSYNAGTGDLSLMGAPAQYDPTNIPGDSETVIPGLFQLNVLLDPSGNLLSGSFSVTGSVPGLAIANTTLLSGTIEQFGYETGTSVFEYAGTVTGGELAPAYGGKFGIINNLVVPFNGDFSQSFAVSPTQGATADIFAVPQNTNVVPEPATAAAFGITSLALLVGATRRRRH
jgi:hypothetical protein